MEGIQATHILPLFCYLLNLVFRPKSISCCDDTQWCTLLVCQRPASGLNTETSSLCRRKKRPKDSNKRTFQDQSNLKGVKRNLPRVERRSSSRALMSSKVDTHVMYPDRNKFTRRLWYCWKTRLIANLLPKGLLLPVQPSSTHICSWTSQRPSTLSLLCVATSPNRLCSWN